MKKFNAQTRRVFSPQLAASITLSLLFIAATVTVSCAEPVRISISSTDLAYLATAVAWKRGFFAEEGLNVEVIRMNANVAMTALVSGDVDYTMLFGTGVRAALRGFPVRGIAGSITRSTHVLIAQPTVKSVSELRGKTMGVSSFGAAADVVGRIMVKHFGVDPEKDIKVISLGSDRSRFAALKEKIIDAAVISPPSDHEARKIGYTILARAYDLFGFPISGLSTTTKTIAEKRTEVKKVIRALIKANRYIPQNREGTIDVFMDWGKIERPAALASYESGKMVFSQDGSVPDDGLRLIIDQAQKSLKITKPVALEDMADFTILREAQKELGLR
ncbi:MAG TPA: ABC transporter substrate-binding protein [Candidatus Acidoferrales bacterium]|nr:ABC transporter substrate-binding protein [Candidatus Acidoferrales bacterium]